MSQRGDSNEYTQYTIFNMKKKKKRPKSSQICSYEIFSKGLKNEFETAVVNEPSVFEPLNLTVGYRAVVKPTFISLNIGTRYDLNYS